MSASQGKEEAALRSLFAIIHISHLLKSSLSIYGLL